MSRTDQRPTDVRAAAIEGEAARGSQPGRPGGCHSVCTRRFVMQALFATIVGYAAEMGVFFAATAALTAGALALR